MCSAGLLRSWRLHSPSEKVSITPVEDMLNCCPRAPVWPKYKTVNRKTDQHGTSWRKSQRIFCLGLSNAYTSIYTAYRRTKMPSLYLYQVPRHVYTFICKITIILHQNCCQKWHMNTKMTYIKSWEKKLETSLQNNKYIKSNHLLMCIKINSIWILRLIIICVMIHIWNSGKQE